MVSRKTRLQGYLVVGHCRNTLRLGTEDTLQLGKALRAYSAVGHFRDTWWLGTARILCGWALQGYSVVGHCRNALPLSTAVRLLVERKDNIDFKI